MAVKYIANGNNDKAKELMPDHDVDVMPPNNPFVLLNPVGSLFANLCLARLTQARAGESLNENEIFHSNLLL